MDTCDTGAFVAHDPCFADVTGDADLPAPPSRQVDIRRLQLNGADFPHAAQDLATLTCTSAARAGSGF